MKNLRLLIVFFAISNSVVAQNNHTIKQKENIEFPELMVFSDEFDQFFSSNNQIEKIVSGKHFLEGPVWVEA